MYMQFMKSLDSPVDWNDHRNITCTILLTVKLTFAYGEII